MTGQPFRRPPGIRRGRVREEEPGGVARLLRGIDVKDHQKCDLRS